MSSNHFVVSKRDAAWQFSYRGDMTGPFSSREEAVAAAIEAAKLADDDVEVLVQNPDLRTETVWSSSE